jgi:flagellar basal-body rod protein FlgB
MSFMNIDLFSVALQRMRHGAARQQLIAENVANADTPGHEARDLAAFDFGRELAQARQGHGRAAGPDPGALARTRPGHMATAPESGFGSSVPTTAWEELPRGEGVALEQQVLAMTETKLRHDEAAAYYRKAVELTRIATSARF